ncbi:hypothetical protein TURU_156645 [Turdus rufiventris]|nr:hypothetical protein TURU_156645 [Turdus rufiventris]
MIFHKSQPHIMSDMVIVSRVLLEPLPVSKVKGTLDIHKSSLQIQLPSYGTVPGLYERLKREEGPRVSVTLWHIDCHSWPYLMVKSPEGNWDMYAIAEDQDQRIQLAQKGNAPIF